MNKRRISIRIEAETLEKMKRAAKKDGKSLSEFCNRIVSLWLVDRLCEEWGEDKKDSQKRKNNLKLRQDLIGLQVFNGGKEI